MEKEEGRREGRRGGREETQDKQYDEQQTTGKDAPTKEKERKHQFLHVFWSFLCPRVIFGFPSIADPLGHASSSAVHCLTRVACIRLPLPETHVNDEER